MNVHPSFGFDPPEPTTSIPFAPNAIYEFKIDTNRDNVADLACRIGFSPFTSDGQMATLRFVKGPQAAATEDGGELLIENAVISLDLKARVTDGGNHRFFAGWRSDPFFSDPVSALNGFQFGRDFSTDKDVCGIVLVVPNSVLGSGQLGLWARTSASVNGRWVQADRGGRPAQSIFLTGEARGAYLAAEPADDANFIALLRTPWGTPEDMHARRRSG